MRAVIIHPLGKAEHESGNVFALDYDGLEVHRCAHRNNDLVAFGQIRHKMHVPEGISPSTVNESIFIDLQYHYQYLYLQNTKTHMEMEQKITAYYGKSDSEVNALIKKEAEAGWVVSQITCAGHSIGDNLAIMLIVLFERK